MSGIDGADELSAAFETVIPERQVGWYVDVAYDVTPWLQNAFGDGFTTKVSPWVRYEDLSLNDQVPDGLEPNLTRDQTWLTVGIDAKPHPNVVLKGEYVHKRHEAESALSDEIRVGAGFVF